MPLGNSYSSIYLRNLWETAFVKPPLPLCGPHYFSGPQVSQVLYCRTKLLVEGGLLHNAGHLCTQLEGYSFPPRKINDIARRDHIVSPCWSSADRKWNSYLKMFWVFIMKGWLCFDYYVLLLPKALCFCLCPFVGWFVGITQILRHGVSRNADGGWTLAQNRPQ